MHSGHAFADDKLGGPAANVDHQTALTGLRQHMGHTLVDQPGLFTPRNHINRKTQNFVGFGQEFIAVARLTQCLGGNSTNLRFLETRQPFTKTRQAVPPALHGIQREVAVSIESVALTYGFLQVFGAVDVASVKAANLQAKTVGA